MWLAAAAMVLLAFGRVAMGAKSAIRTNCGGCGSRSAWPRNSARRKPARD